MNIDIDIQILPRMHRNIFLESLNLKKLFLCTLNLIMRIFTIIYNVLQHYYDNRRSSESWSSLLTSPLAENDR